MNDPTFPKLASAPSSSAAGFSRLYEQVQGWIDADLLLAGDGGALLAEIAAARRARDAGDSAVACRHMIRFLRALEELVGSRALDAADARPALEAARRLMEAACV